MGSRPPSEAGDDGWAAPPRTRRQAASGQPQLTRRDRQQVFIVQDVARELEHNNPGSIHEIKLVFSGRRLQASIVFDRHRGTEARDEAAQRGSTARPQQRAARALMAAAQGNNPSSCPRTGHASIRGPHAPSRAPDWALRSRSRGPIGPASRPGATALQQQRI